MDLDKKLKKGDKFESQTVSYDNIKMRRGASIDI